MNTCKPVVLSVVHLSKELLHQLLGPASLAFYCLHVLLRLILADDYCRRKRETVPPVRLEACEVPSLTASLCTHQPLL